MAWKLHARIKETADVPRIVALTAKVIVRDHGTILDVGRDGYIQKPIEPDGFVAKVESYLLNIA